MVFPRLFAITDSKNASIAEVWDLVNGSSILNFCWNFKVYGINEWAALSNLIPSIHLTDCQGKWIWKLDAKESFSSKSLVTSLVSGNQSQTKELYKKIWKEPCPKMIKLFSWEISHSCFNTLDRLQKRCPCYHSPSTVFARKQGNLSATSLYTARSQGKFGMRFLHPLGWSIALPT